MEPDTLIFGPPFYPANVGPGSWAPKSYLKSSKFTQSILTHGRWSNTTLDEATNLREREHQLKERRMRQMARVSDKFHWEVQEVERIQKEVRARQHRIAQANLCACCAIMIQAAWRTHRARLLARELRGQKLGQMLVRWWRRVKTRRKMAVLKRFIIAAVSRRKLRAQARTMASVKLQKAWRRYMLRLVLDRVVLATAATEMVIEDILVELARRVYIEIKGAVIARAWKKSKRRLEYKNRKGRGGRVFLTQGGASSPRRKPARAAGVRSGLTSDPSSSYPSSRRSPSVRGANKGGKAGGATGFTSPAFLNIVSAVTTAASAAPTADEECRGSSQSSDPPPPLSCRNTPSKEDMTGEKSGALATSEPEGDNGGGEGRERPKPPEPGISLAAQPPDEVARRNGSPKSETSSSKGGDGGGKLKDALVVEKTTVPQPRRPSAAKPSRTSEGRRSHKLAPGGESGSHRPPSANPNKGGKRYSL